MARPASKLPVAESMAQASSILGLPKPALAWAKGEGCSAFRGPRVHIAEFQSWWKIHGERFSDDNNLPTKDVMDRRLKLQRYEREKREDEIKAGKYTLTKDLCTLLSNIAAEQQSALLAVPREQTPKLLGQDAIGIHETLMSAVCKVLEVFQKGTEQFRPEAAWFYEI